MNRLAEEGWELVSSSTASAGGKQVRTFPGHSDSVVVVALSGDGTLLLTGSDKQAVLWEVSSGKRLQMFEPTEAVHRVALSANGYGRVELPHGLARKYPNVLREWGWQFVFPQEHC